MRKPIALTGLMFALAPAAAMAQVSDTDEGEVAINGTVAPLCILGDPDPALVDLGQMAETSGARVGRITVISSRTVTLPDSFCNFAGSVVTIAAGALLSDDATVPEPGFARAVNYTASATGWASGASSATTSALANGASAEATGTGAVQPLPHMADIEVALSGFSVPGDGYMVTGNYSGLVTVTLGPAPLAN